jgi:hypothetical protein
MDRWNVVLHELMPELETRWGALTPKLERLSIFWTGCASSKNS